MTVVVGDIVIYEKSQGNNEIKIDGEKYLIFNEHQLIGIKKMKILVTESGFYWN